MYLYFHTLSPILLKNSFGKVFFLKFWSREYFRENKNSCFGRHFETEHFLTFFWFTIFLGDTDMVQVSCRKFYGKST